MRYHAEKIRFERIKVMGIPALFTDIRIERESVPAGLYLYEVRSDDEGKGDPVQIAEGILVNHFGSIITREPILLPTNGYRDIEPEKDWSFTGEGNWTIKDFMTGKRLPENTRERKAGRDHGKRKGLQKDGGRTGTVSDGSDPLPAA